MLYAAEKNPPNVTTADIAEHLGVEAPNACQVLRRLTSWGLLRVAGFEAPEGGIGRRRKVYELTAAGLRKVERLQKQS